MELLIGLVLLALLCLVSGYWVGLMRGWQEAGEAQKISRESDERLNKAKMAQAVSAEREAIVSLIQNRSEGQ